ncbi:acid phosphatase 1-like [Senna tora]|uniref:Acid phosphatase 1-like n=1 Tax=Senna tora TaxID=362788 RepID=A0A834XDS9_9FABA|nr:acid phosphatase 1-like [Senna tora]
MIGGEYEKDLEDVTERILHYALHIPLSSDGFDAWVFDVDDTCISNLSYYKSTRFGYIYIHIYLLIQLIIFISFNLFTYIYMYRCDPFDSSKFKEWIMKGQCPAVPAVLLLFKELVQRGFKVFLLTGRDQATLSHITTHNLHTQSYLSYHRLILRPLSSSMKVFNLMFIGEYGVFQRQDDEAALISFFFFYSQANGNGFGKHHQDSHLRLDLLPKLGCRKMGSTLSS